MWYLEVSDPKHTRHTLLGAGRCSKVVPRNDIPWWPCLILFSFYYSTKRLLSKQNIKKVKCFCRLALGTHISFQIIMELPADGPQNPATLIILPTIWKLLEMNCSTLTVPDKCTNKVTYWFYPCETMNRVT